jgi:DNA polymerase III subunit epsilon
MRFVAIDFETANPSLASICQIGVAVFTDAGIERTWETLVNPGEYFDERNIALHGIEPKHVEGAQSFRKVFGTLADLIAGQVVVHHCSYDRVAFASSIRLHELNDVKCDWLDSARVVRRAWPEYSKAGYGLKSICRVLDIQFKHHSAIEDARGWRSPVACNASHGNRSERMA